MQTCVPVEKRSKKNSVPPCAPTVQRGGVSSFARASCEKRQTIAVKGGVLR